MNQTMANGVLILRNTVDSGGLRLFADIENSHGREVMGLHYNKIVQLVQHLVAYYHVIQFANRCDSVSHDSNRCDSGPNF